ncbi:hypothetical protein Sango_0846400 [Sesamum angolense]|uniref:Uncharacterized protein n=1 Tax=Sesamum angolense TaxID=2727404 RepID=A0AAE2C0R1_9LAMI|nr:hypothetical protein Sango_0846400 [Sesamum angolense]
MERIHVSVRAKPLSIEDAKIRFYGRNVKLKMYTGLGLEILWRLQFVVSMESNDLAEMQEKYENLLSETYIGFPTSSNDACIEVEVLRESDAIVAIKQLHEKLQRGVVWYLMEETGAMEVLREKLPQLGSTMQLPSKAHVKQEIAILEMENSSSHQNLDCVFELANI